MEYSNFLMGLWLGASVPALTGEHFTSWKWWVIVIPACILGALPF